jgi:hypothetical protein
MLTMHVKRLTRRLQGGAAQLITKKLFAPHSANRPHAPCANSKHFRGLVSEGCCIGSGCSAFCAARENKQQAAQSVGGDGVAAQHTSD